ncbi:DUF2332 family protein [Nitratireductor mangrovi]|uniref:DUF2332 family protein n=1 Tax=Nitratireductor mangrovi TaxID=2599600 RepID=A0A5B8L205_9HYPH|nr:DUF2332 family protein [Nitratireductor mangrovi]QDZ01702.1 DUF2332 family protein [Nitratireductor mangrovi]
MSAAAIRDHFEKQAIACDDLGSPFTARLCRALASVLDRSTVTGLQVLEWEGNPRADALALRLCGGLHALVLSGEDDALAALFPAAKVAQATFETELAAAIRRNDEALVRALDNPPQTNEIARAGMILPGFLAAARALKRPFSGAEIGSSAGLNLIFDRFRYDYGDAGWGNAASPVRLSPEMRGTPPPLDGELAIVARAGSDIRPVDFRDPDQRLRLRSYLWADQPHRLERLDAAIGLAEAEPFVVERADAADFVRRRLAGPRDGTALVFFHTIMWQYLPRATKDAIVAVLDEAGKAATPDSPIARLRMEPRDPNDPFATLSVTTWPGGETTRLAKCDYHGRWIEWTG